jgi:uncharacterized protein YjbJ (UPF0337 family)
MTSDRVKGAAREISGKVKEAAGDLTGNEEMEAEGKADQLEGKGQKIIGKVKDKAGEIRRRVS